MCQTGLLVPPNSHLLLDPSPFQLIQSCKSAEKKHGAVLDFLFFFLYIARPYPCSCHITITTIPDFNWQTFLTSLLNISLLSHPASNFEPVSSTIRRRQWQATPVILPRKSHGWRSLVGCSPWGRYKSVATERLHFHFSLSRSGEGNGNPLQCSCLENPRDGRAWWAAVYGVIQSQTRLKRLSSSILKI